MQDKNSLTTEEKRQQKIAQLKAQLQREEALLRKNQRKERDGQLIVMGVLVEELFKEASEIERARWIEKAKQKFKDRNLTRALAFFERLEHAYPQNKTEI